MQDDKELLRQYAESKSETAFSEFVERHLSFVYSVALRRVGGDVHLAQDVTQRVFTDLARKSSILFRHRAINGWLFVSARYAAAEAVRRERRRREREHEAMIFHQVQSDGASESEWVHLRPGLDDLVGNLAEKDREAVILRFFQNLSFAEIGEKLGLGENAARMRVERALESIRNRLERKGIKSTGGVLALALAGQNEVAVPADLDVVVSRVAAASSASGSATLLCQYLLMNKNAVSVIGLIAAGCIATVVEISRISRATDISGAAPALAQTVSIQPSESHRNSASAEARAVKGELPNPSAVMPETNIEISGTSQRAEPPNREATPLCFYETASSPAEGFKAMTLIDTRETPILYVAETPDLTLQDIAHVAAVVGENNEPILHIRFTAEGQRKFRILTRERSAGGKTPREGIVVEGFLISAPTINQEIYGPIADIVSTGPNSRALFDALLSSLPPEKTN